MKTMTTLAVIAALAACKKDPLEEIKPQIEIRCQYGVQESGRETTGPMTQKIYVDTYLQGTVTNKSGKNLTEVVLATKNSKSDGPDGLQLIQIGDLPAGETAQIWEFMFEGFYQTDKVMTVTVWLHSAKVSN